MVAVNSSNKFLDFLAQHLIFMYSRARRDAQLHQHDLADPLGIFLQHLIKGMKFLGYSLDIVQSVDSQDYLLALEVLLELCLLCLGCFGSYRSFELLRIDADWKLFRDEFSFVVVQVTRRPPYAANLSLA